MPAKKIRFPQPFSPPPGSLNHNISRSASIRGENSPTALPQTILYPSGENAPLRHGDHTRGPEPAEACEYGSSIFSASILSYPGKGKWQHYLFNQYAVELRGKAQIFYLHVLSRGSLLVQMISNHRPGYFQR